MGLPSGPASRQARNAVVPGEPSLHESYGSDARVNGDRQCQGLSTRLLRGAIMRDRSPFGRASRRRGSKYFSRRMRRPDAVLLHEGVGEDEELPHHGRQGNRSPDPKTGLYQVEWREKGRRLTRSLGHREWTRAKRQADEFAAGFAGPELNGQAEAEPESLTLEKLFDIYGEGVTPTKAETSQRSDRAAAKMFLRFFGRGRSPATLSQRDWDRFIRARRTGKVGPSGRPVSDRTIEHDLKFLIPVLNWASKSRDEPGKLFLASNPLRGLKTPREKNPTRVVLSEEEYQTLLEVSRQVDWRFHVALSATSEADVELVRQNRAEMADKERDEAQLRKRAAHRNAPGGSKRLDDPLARGTPRGRLLYRVRASDLLFGVMASLRCRSPTPASPPIHRVRSPRQHAGLAGNLQTGGQRRRRHSLAPAVPRGLRAGRHTTAPARDSGSWTQVPGHAAGPRRGGRAR